MCTIPPPSQPPFVVVPRSAEIQMAEDALDLALVAVVGGTRPHLTTGMVYAYLFNRFQITANEVDVRRHAPEDFVARFQNAADRDRVLASHPGGYLLPLIWRPWRRTTMAAAAALRFRVVVALARVPLHARNAAVAQTVLGRSCAEVQLSNLRDIPDDDDREFFVSAWCWHPSAVPTEQTIYIPEPHVPYIPDAEQTMLPGLWYAVRVRLVAYQDFSTPPGSPAGGDGPGGGPEDGGDGEDGHGAAEDPSGGPGGDVEDWPTPRRDSEDDSGDSNFNGYHPGGCLRRSGSCDPALLVGRVSCPP